MSPTKEASVPDSPRERTLARWSKARSPLWIRLFILALIALVLAWQLRPPAPIPATAPATEFSAERAMKHVAAVAQQPHPLGSAENDRVRQYLIDELHSMGLEPQVQTANVTKTLWGEVRSGKVNNVLARLKGTASSAPVILAAHYDSTPSGPGAADDAAGVAATLETLRALQAGAPLRNDLILLITDGEEMGLLGAKAFVDGHPWAREGGVALNLETRGNTGAVLMFETSDKNDWLIGQFAQAAPHPLAYSLVYDLYKQMPNDTDLTELRRGGLAGLNFAMAGNWYTYHTSRDTVEALDRGSLQDFGSYTLALARQFGNEELQNAGTGNEIFFTAAGILAHYPQSWSMPLVVLAAFAFAALLVLGVRRKRLGLKAGLALPVFIFNVIVAGALGYIAVQLLTAVFHERGTIPSLDSNLYAGVFAALGLGWTVLLYGLLRTRIGPANLTAGAAAGWLGLAALTALVLPGGSYLFVWPLLFSLLALAVSLLSTSQIAGIAQWASLLPAVASLVLFIPALWVLFLLLPVGMYPVGSILAGLVGGLVMPQLST